MFRCRRSLGVPLAIASLSFTVPSWAVDKRACLAAHEQGQRLRADAKLMQAREQLILCAEVGCPDVVRQNCAERIMEIDARLPSLLFAVTDRQRRDVLTVSVKLDGREIATRVDGKPIPVNPGPHTLAFRIEGEPERVQEIVVREGERNRRIEVTWAEAAVDPRQIRPTGPPSEGPSVHPSAWVLGGAGVLGLGLFATFAALGSAEVSEIEAPRAEGGCVPRCSDEVVDSIRTKFLVGDISLIVGSAALVAALTVTIVSLTSGGDEAPTDITVRARPTSGGGFASLEARF